MSDDRTTKTVVYAVQAPVGRVISRTIMVCSVCEKVYSGAATTSGLARQAKTLGWRLRRKEGWTCPTCTSASDPGSEESLL